MTPKEYFQFTFKLDNIVQEKINLSTALKNKIFSLNTKLREELVQTSRGNATEEQLARYFDLQSEINQAIDDLADYRLKIAFEISELSDDRYRMVLSERYVRGKKFEQIAVDRGYDIRWIYKLHGQALQAFGDKFPEKFLNGH